MNRRRIKLAVVIASAALSFGVMCLWSYTSTIDNLLLSVLESEGWTLSVNVQGGRTAWRRMYAPRKPTPEEVERAVSMHIPTTSWTFLGFGYSSGSYNNLVRVTDYWLLAIPLWFVLAAVSGPWVVWLVRWYRRTRAARVGFEVARAE